MEIILIVVLSLSLGFQVGYFFHDYWQQRKMKQMFDKMQNESNEKMLSPIQM